MADKRNNNFKEDKKTKPSITNDQLGENPSEGRIAKESSKGGKCK